MRRISYKELQTRNSDLLESHRVVNVKLSIAMDKVAAQEKELKLLRHERVKNLDTIDALQYAMRLMKGVVRDISLKAELVSNFLFNEDKHSWEKVDDSLALAVK